MTLEYCPRCNQMTNHTDRCAKCGFVDVIGVDLSGTESVRVHITDRIHMRKLGNIIVPDTIEVPVQWLKELVQLTIEFQNRMNSPRKDGRWSTLQKLYEHIDLIREKL